MKQKIEYFFELLKKTDNYLQNNKIQKQIKNKKIKIKTYKKIWKLNYQ